MIVDGQVLTAVRDPAHRRYDHGGARAEAFLHAALAYGANNLVDLDAPFLHRVAGIRHQLDDTVAGNTR